MKRKSPPKLIVVALDAFAKVNDPRIERCKKHPLMNVLVMALCSVIMSADGWDEIAFFAKLHAKWYRRFLPLPHGTPSADTFRRVFEVLKGPDLEAAMNAWTRAVSECFTGEVVAIDGKAIRGALGKAGLATPLHLLHVWATKQKLLLGQEAVAGAPGEVRAIPSMLRRINVKDAIVTTDANGCTKANTHAIREESAHFLLALKGNRGPIHKLIKDYFASHDDRPAPDGWSVSVTKSEKKAHGRLERRVVRATALPQELEKSAKGWCDLNTIVCIDRTREIDSQTTTERHFYITDLPPDAAVLSDAIRAHWSIENDLHWTLDVAFSEDSRKVRDQQSAANLALITRLALMMLKRCPERLSMKFKRKRALQDTDFLQAVLIGRF